MTSTESQRGRLHHTPAGLLSDDTAQSSGMRRLAGVSGSVTGSERIWMGESHVAPGTRSADHHHGESETGIYVLSGHPVFVFKHDDVETRIETQPGDVVSWPPSHVLAQPSPMRRCCHMKPRDRSGRRGWYRQRLLQSSNS